MSLQIVKASELPVLSSLNALMYGKPGVGKTTSLATCCPENPEKLLVLASERNLHPLKRLMPDCDILALSTGSEFESMLQWLATDPDAGKKYSWLGIDSITVFAETILREELPRHKDGRQAYGAMQERMMLVFRNIQNLVFNTVSIARIEQGTDGLTGGMVYQPWFPGKNLGGTAPYEFDLVGYVFGSTDEKGAYTTQLGIKPNDQYLARDCSGSSAISLPLDWAEISKLYNGSEVQ